MIDRLIEQIKAKNNPTVAGLDPTIEMMPEYLKKKYFRSYGPTPEGVAEMFFAFNKTIIDAIYDVVPAVKLQIAMYERFGVQGIDVYNRTCMYAFSKGLLVIGDIKRGDIDSTAKAYAAHLGGAEINGERAFTWMEDAVTVNPYMGSDGIEPFLQECRQYRKGIFVLVKTSNPSSSELQDLVLSDGRTVYNAVAELVDGWGAELIGKYGYSEVGAVVGATQRKQGMELRKKHPHTFFLVPGYGAQGAGADDVAGFFDNEGLGAVVNSSRGITAAYKNNDNFSEEEFGQAAKAAAIDMKEKLNAALKNR